PDPGSGLEQGLVGPSVEAPFDQPGGFLNALVPARHSGKHFDQPPSVLDRRAREAIARLIRVPGLEPVCAGDVTEDRVAVLLGDVLARAHGLAPGEARQAVELLVELGMVLD